MKSSTWTLAVSLVVGLAGVAAAQPTGGDAPPPPPGSEPPPPAVTPPPPPVVTAPPPAVAPAPSDSGTGRPDGLSIGIGAGYAFPTMLDMINNYSVRVRLATGLTLEPRVAVENISQNDGTNTQSSQVFTIGSTVRIPVITHGKFDFEVLGDATINSVSTPIDADNSTRTTNLALNWGLAVAWWITPHFEVSVEGRNPLVAYSRTSASNSDTTTSTTDVGLIFAPKIGAMLHVYY